MKQLLKRITAMLLMLCTLVSFAVPATWADADTGAERVVASYDIWLYDAALGGEEGYNSLFPDGSGKHVALSSLKDDIDALYNAAEGSSLNWTYVASANETNLVYRSSSMMLRLRGGANNWAALKIRVPESGNFALTYEKDGAVGQNAADITAYVFPVSELDGDTSAIKIASLMTPENSVGTKTMANTDTKITFDAKDYTAGEYVVVYQGSINDIWLSELALVDTGTGSETTETITEPDSSASDTQVAITYDIWLYDATLGAEEGYNALFPKGSGSHVGLTSLKNDIDALYNSAEGLNWTYVASANEANLVYRSSSMLLRLRGGANNWAALKIRVPESGNFALTYGVDNTVAANNGSITAWVFPASGQEDATTIPALMTDANCVGTQDMTGSSKVTFDPVSFTAGEYIVVYQGSINDIWLGELGLVEVEGAEEPTETTIEETTEPEPENVAAVYDFTLYNAAQDKGYNAVFNGNTRTFTDSCYCGCGKTVQEHLAGAYESLGWMYLDRVATESKMDYRADQNWGLRVQPAATGDWIAFKITVPTAGTYRLRYNASLGTDAKIGGYLFSAAELQATENGTVAELMTNAAAHSIGSIAVSADVTSATFAPYTVETAGEYILVLQHLDKTYMRIGSLELVEYTGEEPTEPGETTEPSIPVGPGQTACGGTYTDGVYNFALYTEPERAPMLTSGETLVDRRYDAKCLVCGRTVENCLADQYALDQLNWTLEGTSFGNITVMGKSYRESGYGGVRFRYDTDENGEPIMVPDSKTGELENQETPGNFVAYRVKVAKAGTYTLTVNRDYPAGFAADVYVFPATATKMKRSDLTAALTEENKVGAAEFVATSVSSKVGDYTFATAGEYVIALKTTVGKRLYLNTITLTEPVPDAPIPAVNEKVYDFDLSANDQAFLNKPMNGRYNADGSVRIHGAIDQMYADGKTLWKYETKSSAMEFSVISFRVNCMRFKSATNFRDLNDQWAAYRIKNPGTATYDIRLVSSSVSRAYANIYLIPLTTVLTMSEEQVKAGMTEENLLVRGAVFDTDGTFYLGEHTFGTEEEYLMVFEFTKGTLLHVAKLQMTLDGTVADGTVKKEKYINGTVYDFDVNDPLNGYFTESKVFMPDVLGDLNAMWRNGTLKWKWENACDYLKGEGNLPSELNRFYKNTGMRIYFKQDNWLAFRIKSPGSGTFTLSMNYASWYASGTIAVYILPGDTEDIEFAMDPKNRVGKVALYNDGISTSVEDGKSSYLGYWDFEAGKEYIVVIEAYEKSPYAANCYANISQLVAERGKIDYNTEVDKSVRPITVDEAVVPVADPLYNSLVTEIYGHDYFFLPTEGGVCLVYDLDTGELVDQVPVSYSRVLDMRMDKDGMVWFSGAGKYLVRYDPYTQETFKTPSFLDIPGLSGFSGAYTICPAPDGKIYFGTYYNGVLGYYDYQTNSYTVLGEIMDTPRYIAGMTYYDGCLYMNAINDEKSLIIKYDIAAGKVVGTLDVTHMMGTANYLNNLSMLGDGDLLVAGINANKIEGFIAVKPDTMELYEDHGMFGGMSMGATEIIDGKQYLVCSGYGLYEYDVATKTFSKVPGFGNEGIGFRSKDGSLISLNGDRVLFTYTTSGGHPRMFNLDTKEYKSWDDLVRHGSGGAEIRSITNGENDGKLYIGAYNTPQYAIYDEEAGKITGYVKTGGQGDSGVWYNGKFYTGNYSSTTLNEIPMEDVSAEFPATNEILQRLQLNHEETGQKRIHSLAAGDGKVFVGSVPDTGVYGGAVAVYDTKTGRWFYDRTPAGNLAVTKVVYSDKLLWGATSTSPGTGTTAEAPEGSSAMIFAYDYENRQTVAQLDLRKHIRGLPAEIDFIAGFEKDPVVENRFWGVVSETLFCFTYDKENKTFNVQEVISFDKTVFDATGGRHLWSRPVLFDTERNSIYFSFDTNGGFQCIELADWNADIGKLKVVDNTRLMGDKPMQYAMGQDGNLYYENTAELKMLSLNVTDEDWEIAGAVDKMITDLGEIKLESEAAIKFARSAYDNLSWRYKSLIQQLDLLQESETDLLECKIDTIVLETVDADSLTQLQPLMDTYNGFNTRQQKYTKNYAHLLEAHTKATKLNDERVAAALQKRIDALGEKFPLTLDDEPEVLGIRADYDAMTGTQRMLVDITILEDAEAQIKVLRAEFVVYVEQLIQAIPAEITLDAEEVIMTAREAADKLYVNERKQVSYAKLTSAEGKLRTLQKARAAAEEVDALIKAIGIVTLGDKNRIAEARDAYDALNETALGFLTKGKKLVRAEFILKALQTWGIPAITVVNAGIAFAIVWFVPFLHSKVFKGKKKEEEVIDN